MSNKMTCPVCDAYSSNVFYAVSNGEPCPYCHATAELIEQVNELRLANADERLRGELEHALIKLERVTRERNHLARIVADFRRTVIASDVIELVDGTLYARPAESPQD